jgi:hypothetical protein
MTAKYEPVQFRTQPGLGVHVAASGWSRKFLLSPSRNPDAPRLWCVRVDICTSTGDPDPELPALIIGCMFTHTEMVEAFKAIRAETAAWVAADEQSQLRAWLMANDVRASNPNGNGDQSTVAASIEPEEQHAQA